MKTAELDSLTYVRRPRSTSQFDEIIDTNVLDEEEKEDVSAIDRYLSKFSEFKLEELPESLEDETEEEAATLVDAEFDPDFD